MFLLKRQEGSEKSVDRLGADFVFGMLPLIILTHDQTPTRFSRYSIASWAIPIPSETTPLIIRTQDRTSCT